MEGTWVQKPISITEVFSRKPSSIGRKPPITGYELSPFPIIEVPRLSGDRLLNLEIVDLIIRTFNRSRKVKQTRSSGPFLITDIWQQADITGRLSLISIQLQRRLRFRFQEEPKQEEQEQQKEGGGGGRQTLWTRVCYSLLCKSNPAWTRGEKPKPPRKTDRFNKYTPAQTTPDRAVANTGLIS